MTATWIAHLYSSYSGSTRITAAANQLTTELGTLFKCTFRHLPGDLTSVERISAVARSEGDAIRMRDALANTGITNVQVVQNKSDGQWRVAFPIDDKTRQELARLQDGALRQAAFAASPDMVARMQQINTVLRTQGMEMKPDGRIVQTTVMADGRPGPERSVQLTDDQVRKLHTAGIPIEQVRPSNTMGHDSTRVISDGRGGQHVFHGSAYDRVRLDEVHAARHIPIRAGAAHAALAPARTGTTDHALAQGKASGTATAGSGTQAAPTGRIGGVMGLILATVTGAAAGLVAVRATKPNP